MHAGAVACRAVPCNGAGAARGQDRGGGAACEAPVPPTRRPGARPGDPKLICYSFAERALGNLRPRPVCPTAAALRRWMCDGAPRPAPLARRTRVCARRRRRGGGEGGRLNGETGATRDSSLGPRPASRARMNGPSPGRGEEAARGPRHKCVAPCVGGGGGEMHRDGCVRQVQGVPRRRQGGRVRVTLGNMPEELAFGVGFVAKQRRPWRCPWRYSTARPDPASSSSGPPREARPRRSGPPAHLY